MYATERLSKIRKILREKKRIDVPSLSDMLGVSEVTVRRDLVKLEEEGYLVKTFGGAVLQETLELPRVELKSEDPFQAEKEIIGKFAAQLVVEDRDVIFLGHGSTCMEIARNIKTRQRVTVITNDVAIGHEIMQLNNSRLISTGGELLIGTTAMVGEMTLNSLKNIHVNRAFVTVDGIHLQQGYTVNNFETVSLLKELGNISKELIIVADKAKFGRVGLVNLGPLTMIPKVISNLQIPEEYKQYYFENNIQIYTAYDLD